MKEYIPVDCDVTDENNAVNIALTIRNSFMLMT